MMGEPNMNNDQDKLTRVPTPFPNYISDSIQTLDFLTRANEFADFLGLFGKVFKPLLCDINTNIDLVKLNKRKGKSKIAKTDQEFEKELMEIYEQNRKTNTNLTHFVSKMVKVGQGDESLMWLTREMDFIRRFFEIIILDYKAGQRSEDFSTFMRSAYEDTLLPFQTWTFRHLTLMASRYCPKRNTFLSTLANGQQNLEDQVFEDLENYNNSLKCALNRLNHLLIVNNIRDS